ncbi:hypothetical protein [Streptomyces sp. HC307]|uniref:hypothetical protein n=1 Tax=Streptomyces flavusporus TaxID=3385496 RepID=UPI003917169A
MGNPVAFIEDGEHRPSPERRSTATASWTNSAQQKLDHNGQRNVCAADGHPGTAEDSLVKATDGFRVHLSDTTNPSSGYYGQQQAG